MHFSLSHLSVRYQVLLPVMILVVLLLAALTTTKSKLETEQGVIFNNTNDLVSYKDTLSHITNAVYPLRISAVYAIYDPSRRALFLDEISGQIKSLNDDLQVLEDVDALREDAVKVELAIQRYIDLSRAAIVFFAEVDSGVKSKSEFDSFISQYRQSGNEMVKAIDALSQKVNTYSKNSMDQSKIANTDLMSSVAFGIMAVFVVAIILAWVLSGLIVKPIINIQMVMREVAKGNLTIRADSEGDNELSKLSSDVNATVSQLNGTVESLIRISEDVAAAATELATVMTQSEVNAQSELNEIDQVASAVNELSSTADNVSDNATLADSTAKQTDELARQGLSIFEQSNAASREMSHQLREAAGVVTQLKDQSDQINKVIEVIRGISEQTNLLALNAAIEAARAGELGRGFAVVADEVRMLAARTQDSTIEIQSIIEELQSQSVNANSSMQSSLEMLERNQLLSTQANDALLGITDSVMQISDMNTQVATAAEQQSQVTQDISRNITNMSAIVNQNVAGISQSALASNELSRLAEQQKQQLSVFKI
ncbi:chemotaxis protein [Photobacterium aquae]|uniref:Chemotaxis protein n=1 Tax=Photobacterium aquae TaxID=1195763 RepID=A0A0J1HB16_9GAMM|nr:methyl-accepting chemotaxis protein [Photobacterium aquae]KLV08850.1 chemotaxis protein [Photobacterium aquae]